MTVAARRTFLAVLTRVAVLPTFNWNRTRYGGVTFICRFSTSRSTNRNYSRQGGNRTVSSRKRCGRRMPSAVTDSSIGRVFRIEPPHLARSAGQFKITVIGRCQWWDESRPRAASLPLARTSSPIGFEHASLSTRLTPPYQDGQRLRTAEGRNLVHSLFLG
jgi:hypothetical protein